MFSKLYKITKIKITSIVSSASNVIKSMSSQVNHKQNKKAIFKFKGISFDDMKLDKKLAASFAAIIILFVIPVSVSLLKFNETVELLKEINDVTIPEVYLASSVSTNLKEIEKNLYASTLTDNQAKKDDYIEDSIVLYDEAVSSLEKLNSLLADNSKSVEEVLKMLENEAEIRQEIMSSKYKSDASRMIFNSYEPIVNNINSDINIITENINASLLERALEYDKTAKFSIILTISMALSAILLGLIISKIITGSITNPISQIESLAVALSEGNLDYRITYESKNEIGRLAEILRNSTISLTSYINEIDEVMKQLSEGDLSIKTSDKFKGDFKRIDRSIDASVNLLAETMKGINQLASEVSLRSNQLLSNSLNISEGAADQSSSIEESYAAIEEISVYVKSNTENTYDASNRLLNIDNEIALCSESMNKMVEAMSEISYKSKEIEKTIKILDNITFQTNLLALNAAVEAAHAGSAGNGFAVVANEVKNLAANSSEAAKNIAMLIEDTLETVSKGNELANATASSLSKVVLSANDATNRVTEISRASEEQLASIEQIKAEMEHISNVVKANSSTAKESYSDSRELSSRSQMLLDMVNKFVF